MRSAPLALTDFHVTTLGMVRPSINLVRLLNQRDAHNSGFVFKENNWPNSNSEPRLVNLNADLPFFGARMGIKISLSKINKQALNTNMSRVPIFK